MCDRVIKLRLIKDRLTITINSVYTPQAGLTDNQKDWFYEVLLQTISNTNDRDFVVIVTGGFNGHVGQYSHGFHSVYSGYGFGFRNEEGTGLFEFWAANDLMIWKTNFQKSASHLITYQ